MPWVQRPCLRVPRVQQAYSVLPVNRLAITVPETLKYPTPLVVN